MSFAGYLSAQELTQVREAMIAAGLASHSMQDSLRSALLTGFAINLPTLANANAQLFQTLSILNAVHNLRNGDLPLAQYLAAAISLAQELPQADVLDRALNKARYSAGAPPLAVATALGAPGAAPNVDVTPEAQTSAFDQTVSVRFLRDGLAVAASVAKLLVHRHMNGAPEFNDEDEPRLVNATGWIVAPKLLITNFHVVNARRKEGQIEPDASAQDFQLQAENTRIMFNYVDKAAVPQPVSTGPGALVVADAALDFAILRLPPGEAQPPPLRFRSHVIRKTLVQALGSRVNLLQHPNGNPMRLGFRNNYVVVGDDTNLSYLTDTAVGSSGSPVCDDSWKVAALHSGSRAIADQNIEILGHKYRRENYGIPIAAIMAYILAQRPDIHAEISAAQAQLNGG